MTSAAIIAHPIRPIATFGADKELAIALTNSTTQYYEQLRGRRIWLACSGGRDSLTLAAICCQLYHQGRLPFLPQLLHVDHNLQADSILWANHVAHWAKAQQMPCTILRVKVDGYNEQAARQARYNAMLNHINQNDVLMLAHHADDQAETVLMRLIQGAGVRGLSAMQPWREQIRVGHQHQHQYPYQHQRQHCHVLWRPWLSVARSSISHAAQDLALPYINDPTNTSGDNVRSSIRRDVMPLLAQHNPNVIDNIARSALILRDAQATITEQAEQDLQHTSINNLSYLNAQQVLAIDQLSELPEHRQRQLLHHWLTQNEPLPPSKQLVDDVLLLTLRQDTDHQTQLNWFAKNQQYSIQRYRHHLFRLSHYWLKWLTIPIIEQTQILSTSIIFADDKRVKINIRSDEHYHWKLQLDLKKWNELMGHDNSILKITSLDRQQRLKTSQAQRPQAGKKLYQTLGIPVWLRESLVVISLNYAGKEIPLLLLSPFERWQLSADDSLNLSPDKIDALIDAISNTLG